MRAVAGRVAIAAAVAFFPAAVPAAPRPLVPDAPQNDRRASHAPLLDVPYLAQTEDLCGGAAVAMVLRYWGARQVYPEDFAALVDRSAAGIHTDVLTGAVQQRGWQAHAYSAGEIGMGGNDVRQHLQRGRPIIALIEDRPGTYHYVVIVAWSGDQVVLHDPARAPFQVMPAASFERAWTATGSWALLVLPSDGDVARAPPVRSSASADADETFDRCGPLVGESVRRARAGDLAGAESGLDAATRLCPRDPAAWRELAGLRFLQSRWRDASRLAARAVALDHEDDHAWELLATSRFLDEDPLGALEAWNRIGRPQIDIVRVEGARRTRHPVVTGLLDLPPRSLLTPGRLQRSSRRLSELPAAAGSRVRYRLDDAGLAQIDAVVVERPVVPRGLLPIAAAVGQALVHREVRLNVAGPTGGGELWSGAWRWWEARPRATFELAVPAVGRLPGTTHIEALWEEQSYVPADMAGSGSRRGASSREARRRAGVHIADWATGALRWQVGGALDRWNDDSHVSLDAALDVRLAHDRVSIGAGASVWSPTGPGRRFGRGDLTLAWRSRDDEATPWSVSAGVTAATAAAPLGLWPGAGTGHARSALLRAHPLLDEGVISGSAFGRRLAYGSAEYQHPLRSDVWSLRLAAFVDAARAWDRGQQHRASLLHVDAGFGLRASVPGVPGTARVDLARGVRDGALVLSAGWQSPWPRR